MKRYTNYCPTCQGLTDFFDDDVFEINKDGNMVFVCPECGAIVTSNVNVNDLMDVSVIEEDCE